MYTYLPYLGLRSATLDLSTDTSCLKKHSLGTQSMRTKCSRTLLENSEYKKLRELVVSREAGTLEYKEMINIRNSPLLLHSRSSLDLSASHKMQARGSSFF